MARNAKPQEHVMVVHRDDIFRDGEWHGINPAFLRLLEIVRRHHKFLPRHGTHGVEQDSRWQQIIPFGVLASQGRIFCYIKSDKSGESRLHHERMIGIGGHLRERDTIDHGSLLGWFEREWCEEVRYEGLPFAWPIGVIHDTSRPVSAVHLGFAFLLYGDKLSISVKADEELTEAKWLTLDELFAVHREDKAKGFAGIDNWSMAILEYLKNNRELLAL